MTTNDVFISYRRKNIEFVKELAESFNKNQRSIWVDWEDIPPGAKDFTREIALGIEEAHIFIAVLSPDYLESEYCLQELAYANSLNKRLIPIVHQRIESSQVPDYIRRINWVYFIPHAGHSNAFPTAFEAVLHAIDTDYDHIREHTRLLNRALEWENNEKNASFLLGGDELDAAESWLAGATNASPHPADVQAEYILHSRRWQAKRQRRLLSGALTLLTLAVIGLIVAVVAGVIARQQQMIAERRSAETLSLAAANAAAELVADGEYLDGLRLAYFASTSIDQPPERTTQTLRQIAFQPGTRYAYFDDLPADMNTLGLNPGETANSSDRSATMLMAEDETRFTIRDADGQVIMSLNRLVGPPFRGTAVMNDDIHPGVLSRYENPLLWTQPMDLNPTITMPVVAVGTETGLLIVENNEAANEVNRLDGHTLPVDGVRFSEDGANTGFTCFYRHTQ